MPFLLIGKVFKHCLCPRRGAKSLGKRIKYVGINEFMEREQKDEYSEITRDGDRR
jgi:hypothetical protein